MSKKGIVCSAISVVGFGVTVGLAIHETPSYLEDAKKIENPRIKDKIKLVFKHYYPAMITGVGTLGSICTNCIIEQKTQAQLSAAAASAYGLYKRYGNEVKTKLGIDTHKDILNDMSKKEVSKLENVKLPEGEELYWNDFIGHFTAKPQDVEKARYIINKRMMVEDMYRPGYWISIHDFLVACNARNYNEDDDEFTLVGWDYYKLSDSYNETPPWIDIEIDEQYTESNGIKYKCVYFNDQPIGWDTDNEHMMDQELKVLERGYNGQYPRE